MSTESEEMYSVKQIREAFAKHARTDDWGVRNFYQDGLIAALRGQYDREPRPEEPTGLGAVVEDAEGVQWIRADTSSYPWMSTATCHWFAWEGIDAVKVLSEGVQS